MSKKYIIPIFVPHLGCPNDCVFCNQKSISGQMKMVTEDDVTKTIEEYLKSFKDDNVYKEVAFFGGSFTGIDPMTQVKLLKAAAAFIDNKQIDSIRISTRPDYINKDILKLLKKYHVKTIELGVQSTNDTILENARRGHTYKDVKKASKLIRRKGFILGHQMMVGLPGSTREDELKTAKDLIKLKPKMVRIYPVLVIKNTELEKMYKAGVYEPLPVNTAVERCKEILYLFNNKKIDVIRIGLQNTDFICDPKSNNSEVVAGPFHPAFGQLVEDSIWYDCVLDKVKNISTKAKTIKIEVNPEHVNNIIGHKKENLLKLKEAYNVEFIIEGNENMKPGKIKIEVVESFEN